MMRVNLLRVRRWLLELQYLAEFALVWPLVWLARRVSERRAYSMAQGLGRLGYRLLGRDRRWGHRNLELVFEEHLSAAQRTKLVMGSFENIVRTRVELLRFDEKWMLEHVIEEGGEFARRAAREAAARGVGVIMITGHLGCFELIPPHCYHSGFGGPVMYRPQNNWRVERLLLGARSGYLTHNMVPRGPFAVLSLMHALREGQSVGLLIDINTLDSPTYVDFLGYSAASPAGAAALALSTGAPVLLAVTVRRPDGKHRLIFHPPFELIETGNRRHDIAANTQQYTRALEAYILAYPEQYNWPHPRWRFRPDRTFWTLDVPAAQQRRERLGPARALSPGVVEAACLPSEAGGGHVARAS